MVIFARATSPGRRTRDFPPGAVELDHVTVLGPPGVQAKTILTLSIKFVMRLLPGLFEVVELFPGVIISPHAFLHLCVFRPVSPGFA